MVDMLKINRIKLIGHLHELFWWGLDNADAQGVLGRIAAVDIAEAACWPAKDAERFVRALLECGGDDRQGFLEQRSGVGYVLHDWYDYAGQLNDKRELRRESNRRAQSARRQRLRSADNDDSQHPNVAKRSEAKRSVADPPLLPPQGVSADAADHPNGVPPSPSCCTKFAATGSEHLASCSTRAMVSA